MLIGLCVAAYLDEKKVMHDQIAIGNRIKAVRELLGYTQSGISAQCGSKLRSWQEYEKGGRSPGSQVIAGLVSIGVNANWLLTGEGEMLTAANNGAAEPLLSYSVASDDYAYVQKLVDVHVSAGDGAEPSDGDGIEELAFKRKWLAMEGLSAKNLRVVACRGDSMAPTIPEDSTLLVDISQNDFVREGVYVIRLDGHLFAKRLQRGQGGSIHVISDNTLYDKIIVTPEKHDFQMIGKAVWLGHTM